MAPTSSRVLEFFDTKAAALQFVVVFVVALCSKYYMGQHMQIIVRNSNGIAQQSYSIVGFASLALTHVLNRQ